MTETSKCNKHKQCNEAAHNIMALLQSRPTPAMRGLQWECSRLGEMA